MMPAPRARLIRRAPLSERLKAYLNPWDWLIWLSEELNSGDWEDFTRQWSLWIGLIANVVYMTARANASSATREASDDIFGDSFQPNGSGWLSWLLTIVSRTLELLAFSNALYTFYRKRHYRLFEHSVDIAPPTPSARRVRVDSTPLSFASAPFQSSRRAITSSIFSNTSAASRAHPDPARDVWEVAVWDPSPLCLAFFTYFSPGHVLLYRLFLPLQPHDARPSVTVVTAILSATLLTIQMTWMRSSFLGQARDSNFINKQVHAEYEFKFVKPSLNRPVRDVGTQLSFTATGTPISGGRLRGTPEVQTYTPTTYVNRGFRTHPNENYAGLYSPDGTSSGTAAVDATAQSPIAVAAAARAHRPAPRASVGGFASPPIWPAGRRSQDGGSLSVYTNAQSPLKQATAANAARARHQPARQRLKD